MPHASPEAGHQKVDLLEPSSTLTPVRYTRPDELLCFDRPGKWCGSRAFPFFSVLLSRRLNATVASHVLLQDGPSPGSPNQNHEAHQRSPLILYSACRIHAFQASSASWLGLQCRRVRGKKPLVPKPSLCSCLSHVVGGHGSIGTCKTPTGTLMRRRESRSFAANSRSA
jgi:hypothetical protein